MVGESELGALAVYDRDDERPFSNDDLAILQILANQVAIALENDRLSEALQDMAVLEERERIAKELHDGVIQSIYSVGLALQGSTSLMSRDPGLATQRIDQAIAELDNVVRDVRSYIFELRPKVVEEQGLEEAIRLLVRDLEVNTLAHTILELDEETCSNLAPSQEHHVVQIVREVLSNIARHSQASEVSVAVETAGSDFRLSISDDGIGFDPAEVARGNGLNNIEQRSLALTGAISIARREPKGMHFELRFPIHEETR
jgi:signal transduction histidine kinase